MSNVRISYENALAEALLKKTCCNPKIQAVLIDIATILYAKFFISVKEEIKSYEEYDVIPQPLKEVINSWAIQHSEGDRFYGALLPESSLEQLKQTAEGRLLLLSEMEKALSVDNIQFKTLHDTLRLIKVLDGLGYYYLSEAREKANKQQYELIKSMILPSEEELKLRHVRKEKVIAVTYGIGTEINKDLIPPQKITTGGFPGKARFFIPKLEKNSPWFQKLACEKTSLQPLPLIASVSFSTSRSLITLLHLGAFNQNKKGEFDLDKAQIYANCLMGYFVFCGHHSFLEVMEVWNRVLDYVAIYHPEQLPAEVFTNKSYEQPYDGHAEKQLPYGHVGSYQEFLHTSYAASILESAESHIENQEIRFSLR